MSRLNEALRRSGLHPSTEAPTEQDAAFRSPWTMSSTGTASTAAALDDSTDRPETPEPVARLVVTPPPDGLRSRWKEWLVSPDVDPQIAEPFRRLAATLFHAQRDSRLRTLMVTSAVPGEGKTLTALNLALVLSESYKRSVLLIDADLRRPRLSEATGLNVARGLADALKAEDEDKVSAIRLTEHLTLLPAGRPDPEPLSGLTSSRMQHLLEEGAERFDWVIIDTPPIAAATDAGLLSAMVDGTVFVVRAGLAPYQAVRHAIDVLGQDRIVGVVLNGVERADTTAYGGHYYGNYGSK